MTYVRSLSGPPPSDCWNGIDRWNVCGLRRRHRHEVGLLHRRQVGLRDQVHHVAQPEVATRLVDVDLPGQPGADVLHLHADLAHLAPQLVVDQLVGGVLDDVAAAGGVGVVGDVLNVVLKLRVISLVTFSLCVRDCLWVCSDDRLTVVSLLGSRSPRRGRRPC